PVTPARLFGLLWMVGPLTAVVRCSDMGVAPIEERNPPLTATSPSDAIAQMVDSTLFGPLLERVTAPGTAHQLSHVLSPLATGPTREQIHAAAAALLDVLNGLVQARQRATRSADGTSQAT